MNNFLQGKIKKIIFILILIIIIVFVTILILFLKQKKETEDYLITHPNKIELQKMEQSISVNEYFAVKDCINKYYTYINYLNNSRDINIKVDDEYKKEQAKTILNILNKEYVEKNNINEDSIIKQYNNYTYDDFTIEKTYYTENDNYTTTYLILGKQISSELEKAEDYGFLILLDKGNETFSIAPYEVVKDLGLDELKEGEDISSKIKINTISKVEDESNIYEVETLEDKQLINSIFLEYKKIAKYDPEYAYNLLDEEYSKNRFKDFDEGKEYLEKNVYDVFGYKIDKMSKDESDPNFTRYVCQDNKENYFVIKKDDQLMKYTIILDVYTVSIPEIEQKYNNSNSAGKTVINLEKFQQMINLNDYKSAYNTLNKSFREKNFKNVENFEKYVKQNWAEYIKISYKNYESENGEVGTLSTEISDRDSQDEEPKTVEKTFIVKLIDANNFEMSFNID